MKNKDTELLKDELYNRVVDIMFPIGWDDCRELNRKIDFINNSKVAVEN